MTQFIELVNSCAAVWWPIVFHAAWQSGLIAIVILLFVTLGRRWPSPLRYALVMIALIKFLVPPFFAAPTGALSLLRLHVTPPSDAVGQDNHESAYPAVAVNRDSSIQSPLKEDLQNDGEENAATQQPGSVGTLPTEGSIQIVAAVAESSTTTQPASRSATRLTLRAWMMLIHLAGGILVAVCVFIQYVRVARIAHGGGQIVEGELDTLFRDAGRKLGLRRPVELRLCSAPVPPLAFGALWRVVVVSHSLLQRLAKDEQQAILAHELAHHRRWDLWVIWLQAAMIALWWFHPLAWCVNYTLGRLREDCCDDLLLHGQLTTCQRYCNALIHTVEWCAAQSVLCQTTWPVPRMHPFGGRIVRVMDGSLRRSPALSVLGVFIVSLLACVALPGVTQVAALQTTAKQEVGKRDEQLTVKLPPSGTESPTPRSQGKSGNDVLADGALANFSDPTAGHVDFYGDALPQGAMSRLGTIRYRHVGWHKRAAFVPDTDTLIVGSDGGPVCLLDARTGKVLHDIDTGDHYVQSFQLTPDGKQIAILASKLDQQTHIYHLQLTFWDARTAAFVSKIEWTEPFPDCSQRVAFTPNGNIAAFGTMSGAVRLTNAKSGAELKSRAVVRGDIESLAFSPDGELLSVGSRGGAAIWEWRTDKEPQALPGLPRGANVIEFSPDGTLFATGSDDSFAARLWDVGTRRLVSRLQGKNSSYHREGLAFTSDGRFLAVPALQGKSIELFDVSTGKLMRKLSTGFAECSSVAISTRDKWIAAVGSNPVIEVWDFKTGEVFGEKFIGHHAEPREIKFAPNDKEIVSSCLSGMVAIWNVSNGQPVRLLPPHVRYASLDISPDGTKIATSSHDNTVRLWDAATGRQIFRLAGHGRLGSLYPVQFTPDGKRFLSFGPDGFLRVWDVVTGKAIHEHAIRPGQVTTQEEDDGKPFLADPFGDDTSRADVRLSQFTADSKFLLWPIRGKVHVFDVMSGKQIRQHDAPTDGHHAFSPDGAIQVTAEARPAARDPGAKIEDSRIRLQAIELASGKTKSTFEFPGRFPHELRFSPNGRLVGLAAGSVENPKESVISVWEWETGNEVARVTGMAKQVSTLAFSRDTKLLAASYVDSTILVWDLAKFSPGEIATRKGD